MIDENKLDADKKRRTVVVNQEKENAASSIVRKILGGK